MKATAALVLIFLAKVCSCEIKSQRELSPTDGFPDLFQIDDYYSCPQDHSFCSINLKLIPRDRHSEYWKKLESWSASDLHYDRTLVRRKLCIPPRYKNPSEIQLFAETQTNKQMEVFNLTSKMLSSHCLNRQGFYPNIKPYVLFIVLHVALVLTATLYDMQMQSQNNLNTVQKLLMCFSLLNYKRAVSKAANTAESTRLRCMQGVRFFSTIGVIGSHVMITHTTKFFQNPEQMEQTYETMAMRAATKFSLVAIQVFFILSSWLLTGQILHLQSKDGQLTIRHCVFMLIHRIARIWPLLSYKLFIIAPLYFRFANGPNNMDIINPFYPVCSSSSRIWTFLHVTNFFRNFDICHFGLWSLSLDMQFYLANIVLIYFMLKYKVNIKMWIAILIAAAYFIYALQLYYNKITVSQWSNLQYMATFSEFNRPELSYIYFGFWANFISSLIGVIFGYIDYQTKNIKHPVLYEKTYGIMWLALLFAFLLLSNQHGPLETALLIPLFKAFFSLGVSMGIYGLSRGIIRGPFKWMMENKFVSTFANFTFGVYICHFMWVISRGAHSSQPVQYSFSNMFRIYLEDIIVSFGIGIIATFMISLPCLYLEKLLLPPITSTKPNETAKENDEKKAKDQ